MNKDILCRILDHTTSQEELEKELNLLNQPNWENLLDASIWHGIKPLVYLRLKPLFGKTIIPAIIHNDLRDAYIHSVRKNSLILHYANKMLKALKSREIDVINM